jgi:Helicase associated domain
LQSDDSSEWELRRTELADYVRAHGDAHCGFRQSDPKALSRWCKKQRTAHKSGTLPEAHCAALAELSFAFDSEVAEWRRWYNELCRFRQVHGVVEPGPFTAESEFYLRNWCSVQRVSRRNGRLGDERIALLDELGFDWSAADPLS